ncbi:phosphoglucosamine mutase [Bacteroidota bacterium]
MTIIKSISGIRGTIGGKSGDGLTPMDIVKYSVAYGWWLKKNGTGINHENSRRVIVIGRDSRLSGEMVNSLVCGALIALGYDIIDIGPATTPTVEMAVTAEKAIGGIIITASHNPEQWNALKLLNSEGEFLSDKDGKELLNIADNLENEVKFCYVNEIGNINSKKNYAEYHINKIIDLSYVDVELIRSKKLRVVIDCINSVGNIVLPSLLKALGVNDIVCLNDKPDGKFQHNPEPLPENLTELSQAVVREKADLGFAVDPDVDRLAIINEDGSFFGEEYTIVAVADYILGIKKGGNTVSNLSSSRALRDITNKHGGKYFASAVGEVNVVESMKKNNAVIGGEGNGGVILPELHYGRDAMAGIALFLTYLTKSDKKCSALRSSLPVYYMCKKRIDLEAGTDINKIFSYFVNKYNNFEVISIDGIKINFIDKWVHLRKSNTEAIIRIYTEAKNKEEANKLALQFLSEIESISE